MNKRTYNDTRNGTCVFSYTSNAVQNTLIIVGRKLLKEMDFITSCHSPYSGRFYEVIYSVMSVSLRKQFESFQTASARSVSAVTYP